MLEAYGYLYAPCPGNDPHERFGTPPHSSWNLETDSELVELERIKQSLQRPGEWSS